MGIKSWAVTEELLNEIEVFYMQYHRNIPVISCSDIMEIKLPIKRFVIESIMLET